MDRKLTLVFEDHFDDEVLNDKVWTVIDRRDSPNKESQYYRKDNYYLKDSKLVLVAKKEDYEGKNYTSCLVNTRDKYTFKYGRIEICAKLPKGRGTWPALWFVGHPEEKEKKWWPMCGEIDLMEHVGYNPNFINCWFHTGTCNHRLNTQRGGRLYVKDIFDKFHVYALEWTKDFIDIYVDDIRIYSLQRKDSDTYGEWPFDHPYSLLMNIAIGGQWGGSRGIDDSIFPVTMEIDYVRYYKMENEEKFLDLDAHREYL